ncbi:twin-arginine translocase TatA/TatE family subunit [Sphingopyxis yananensis]|uniref:twin-arginine translocase TatA/TatE family subunit n=1 Tax=Sphingopyxis yananensis TaxID=2886687 RepID=UPI001D0FE77F|nr:twin-arginine translocase TatA/TatE family subunit [Sphingopyxis yananensis]MCC2603528.1 twin-arginine translocase TatA/TatE family subunit [Sphingopyxis yananensis]
MGSFSIWHWLVVGILVLLLFGKGRFSDMMGDVAKGLKSFKKGMADDEDDVVKPRHIEGVRSPETPAQQPQNNENKTL